MKNCVIKQEGAAVKYGDGERHTSTEMIRQHPQIANLDQAILLL
jgi:hypothetical protein